jgi:hypothetical protein
MFSRYIGIDYSGAQAPVSRLRSLQVYLADGASDAAAVPPLDKGARNWCRKEVAVFVREQLIRAEPCIIGIDHGFSFPAAYFERHQIDSWNAFLEHFCEYWPTDRDHMYVDFVREQDPPGGTSDEMRLSEMWTASAKSVFQFDMQGSVAKSTHAGIPWLKWLRDDGGVKSKTCFWPFDGFSFESGRSVVAEIYPSLFRRRYPRRERSSDEQDAYAVAAWLKDMDGRGALAEYFNPPLTLPERRRAKLEGWILGVR